MAKKGTCTNCGRENISLVSKGLCWRCYDAQRGLEGGKREVALANIRTKPVGKYKERPAAKDTAETAHDVKQNPPEWPAIKESPAFEKAEDVESDPQGLKLYPAAKDPSEGQPPLPEILLQFAGQDAELYEKFLSCAVRDRRDPVQQILHIIEKYSYL